MIRGLRLAAILCLLALPACRTSSPRMAKDAGEVRVSVDEADRAFLYSALGQDGLFRLRGEAADDARPARLYAYDHDGRRLVDVSESDLAAERLEGRALISVSVQEHGAAINLWDWIQGDVARVDLRLDSFSAHAVEPPPAGGRAFDVVFAAREGSLFPFCADRDFEIFRARIAVDARGDASLLDVRQLTHNGWDDEQPAFSPDGQWIVYVSRRLGPANLALMDRNGDYIRLLTSGNSAGARFPVVLPGNEECLYVSDAGGVTEFYICGLDGRGHRRASPQELKEMLFSWDDGTRHAYLLTEAFAQEQSLRMLLGLPRTLDFMDLVLLAEWNSPLLKQYREKMLAARAETDHNLRARGARADVSVLHMTDTGVLVDEGAVNPGDRSVEGLARMLFTLSFPLFQGSLNKAIAQRDRWQEAVYSQTYLKRYNELVYNVARAYADYSEQRALADLWARVLDLERKRRFIWQARVAAGRELPDRPQEAESRIAQAQADLSAASGRAEAARSRLCALLGLNDMEAVRIEPAPMDWEEPPMSVPPLEQFQGLAQLNRPELARLKFLELRAAAIRDMGPPETRERPRLDLTYGYGTDNFFGGVVDDFISAGISHSLPLDRLGIGRSYREQWTHEMLAYRNQREQLRLDFHADLQETYSAIRRTVEQFQAARSRRDLDAERLRLARIRAGHGAPSDSKAPDAVEPIEAAVELLKQRMAVVEVRAELSRHVAQYYYRAGLARRFVQAVARGPEPDRSGRRAVWLWRSLEVATDPAKRDDLLRVCAEAGVTRIYCFIGRGEQGLYLREAAWEFGYLLELCRERGIEVQALVGNPQWVDESQRAEVGAVVRSIVEFNSRTQEGRAGFTGIKLDVEPHALPRWREPDGRKRLVRAYLELLDFVRGVLGGDGAGLPLSADVPLSYADVAAPDGEASLFGLLCSRLDALTVMAYVRDPEELARRTLPLLATAQEHGIELEVGVETAPGAPASTALDVASIEELLVTLDGAYERFAAYASFAGFAVHDYRGLARLVEKSHGR